MTTAAPTPGNWLSILTLGVIWGGTFMVVALALRGYGPLTVAAARTTLGALALLGLAAILRRPAPSRAAWPHLAVIGALTTALPFSLLSWGQQYVPSAFAGVSMATLPLFVLPLSHLFSDERMSPRSLAGVATGFAGALVLVGPSAWGGGGPTAFWGGMACLAAAVSYAVAAVLTRRCPPVDPIVLAAATLAVGAVLLLPAMLLVEGVPGWAGPLPGAAILFLGLAPTALAALLRVVVIRSAGAVFMTLVNYQVPLWSVLFGATLLDEALPARFFAALALILGGLLVSQWHSLGRVFGAWR